MAQKLWTKNFVLVTVASTLGSAGAIAGGFALSFFVFDETQSTLAAALITFIQLIPFTFVPVIISPLMDRLPRKNFMVIGDLINGGAYVAMGLWLMFRSFSYIGYLIISLLLACLGSIDELAFTSLYPELIPKGAEQKGYAVSSMLYPVLKVILMPLAGILLDTLGVSFLLIGQGFLSLCASFTESFIKITETKRKTEEGFTFRTWVSDIKEATSYLKNEGGLKSLYTYMAVTNGIGQGYGPLLVAFFRTFPGLTAAMYSLFSVAEFAGRTIGSSLQYKIKIPPKKKYGFAFFVYQFYETMDICLLWLPYPFMLLNRTICGFLGSNSAIMREAAVQRYIPNELRSRINALLSVLMTIGISIFSLLMGFLGEILDYRLCVTIGGTLALVVCWICIGGNKKAIKKVYEKDIEIL